MAHCCQKPCTRFTRSHVRWVMWHRANLSWYFYMKQFSIYRQEGKCIAGSYLQCTIGVDIYMLYITYLFKGISTHLKPVFYWRLRMARQYRTTTNTHSNLVNCVHNKQTSYLEHIQFHLWSTPVHTVYQVMLAVC